MADTKISALTAATTPLAGTEQLPIVQGGETRRVSASALGGGASLHPGYRSNSSGNDLWYPGWEQPINATAYANGGGTFYHPLILPTAATISRLGINVAAGGSGATVRLGIYSSVNGFPSSRLVESPTVSSASSGFKESVLTTPLALPAGIYWLASCPSGFAASFSGYGIISTFAGGFILGGFYPINWSATNLSAMGGLTGNPNLPTTETLAAQSNGSTYIPAVYFKVS